MINIGNKKMIDGFVGNKKILRVFEGSNLVYQNLLPYLKFASDNNFTMSMYLSNDGIVEYSLDNETWQTFTGPTQVTSTNKVVYLRGRNNTYCKSANASSFLHGIWFDNGDMVSCEGNIEGLLDYTETNVGHHPVMGIDAYKCLFAGTTGLTTVPSLPAITLTEGCYQWMFAQCENLTELPRNLLPSMVMTKNCYNSMFYGCKRLGFYNGDKALTLLPATTLAEGCYANMFAAVGYDASGSQFVGIPYWFKLPATTLEKECYAGMFNECESLLAINNLELNATSLATSCYSSMFSRCIGISHINSGLLPATSLAESCYANMFMSCSNLETLPELNAAILPDYCYASMFEGCSKIVIGPTQTIEYTNPFKIPSIGATSSIGTNSISDMFKNTGGLTNIQADTQYYYCVGTVPVHSFSGTNKTSGLPSRNIPFEYSSDGGSTWNEIFTSPFSITGVSKLKFKLSSTFFSNVTLTSSVTGTITLTTSESEEFLIYEDVTNAVITTT